MTRANRMLKTERVVKRRKKIILEKWRAIDHKYLNQSGRLEKSNLSCRCSRCKRGVDSVKYKLSKASQEKEAVLINIEQ